MLHNIEGIRKDKMHYVLVILSSISNTSVSNWYIGYMESILWIQTNLTPSHWARLHKYPGILFAWSTLLVQKVSQLRRFGLGLGWFTGWSDMDWVGSEGQSVPAICSKASLPSIDRVCSVQFLRRWKVSRSRILRFQLKDVIFCCLLIASYRKVEE